MTEVGRVYQRLRVITALQYLYILLPFDFPCKRLLDNNDKYFLSLEIQNRFFPSVNILALRAPPPRGMG